MKQIALDVFNFREDDMFRELFHILILSLILTLVEPNSLTSVTYECPANRNPEPCECSDADGKVFLLCSSLQNRQQLKDAVAKMAGFGITELIIKNSDVTHIPRDLFKDSPVSQIRIENTRMIYLFDDEVKYAVNTITEITMYGVDFEGGLDWSVLDNLLQLTTLSVSKSGLEKIPYGMSELELPLETLILEENYIQDIYELGFSGLKELKNLVLKNNFLHEFKRTMLPGPESKLQFLDLSYNRLTSLPDDMFDGMGDLQSLFLGGNKFKVLGKAYMQKIFTSLSFLDVSNNPLKCDCEMTWLLSEKKPPFLTGQCSFKGQKSRRNIKDLTRDDFAPCFV